METLVVAPSSEGDITMFTEQICSECGEGIVFTEETTLLQVVQPYIHDGEVQFFPVLDDSGDFLYEPHYVQFTCWEDVASSLEETLENCPPVEDALSPLRCKYCESGIRALERCGALFFGEIHISKRAPSGNRSEEFVDLGKPYLICLPCLALINLETTEFWEEGICQDNECHDCVQERCWRNPVCTCHCHA